MFYFFQENTKQVYISLKLHKLHLFRFQEISAATNCMQFIRFQ